MSNEVKFKGRIERCTYNTDDFKIYAVNVDKNIYPFIKFTKYGNATITGGLHYLGIDQVYEIIAEEQHTKYGYSYKVKNIRKERPKSENDIYIFLQEVLTKNQAAELWVHYPDIVDIILEDRTQDIDLSVLHGIGEKKFEIIKSKIIENYALYDLIVEFKNVFTITMLRRIYDKYPSITKLKNKLREEPYKCLCGISGIGFVKADNMLLQMESDKIIDFGYELKSSEQRCLAFIHHLLQKNEEEGNTKTDLRELRQRVIKQVGPCAHHYVKCLKHDSIYYNKETYDIAFKKTYDVECYIAKRIKEGLSTKRKWNISWNDYKAKGNYELTEQQLLALKLLCEENIVILNGYSGSGKSATAGRIIQMLEENGKTYKLFAPTGKAAKVLADYTGKPASTIHRGLGYIPPGYWSYGLDHQLNVDVLIIDEFSMTDAFLFENVLLALDFNKTKLLMIGDAAQIPSVACANLFHDFIQSGLIPKISLTKIFRYTDGGLMKVATDVRNGISYLKNINEKKTVFGTNKDYIYIEETNDKIADTARTLYTKILEKGYKPEDIQVLTAYNKGSCGSIVLNNEIQKVANDNLNNEAANKLKIGETTFYINDIVIQKINNYKATIYYGKNTKFSFDEEIDEFTFVPNGITGKIVDIIADKEKTVIINFDGVLVEYTIDDMRNVKLGYCISIHSSQGGSAKVIILLTPSSHTYMLNSNLIYVGLTRMKEICYHIGDKKTINYAVRKKANFQRNTFMQELLKQNK